MMNTTQLLEDVTETGPLQPAALPILATANDVRELVQFLKKRPSGVCVSDVSQPIKKRIFYHKKIAAYEFWGIVTKTGEHLKLSPLGWKFAESLEPEAQIYRKLISETVPYRSFLEQLYRQQIDVITHEDVANFWVQHHPGSVVLRDGSVASGPVVCFFHLCQAAELGTMTIGKRGQPARLRILRNELRAFIEQAPLSDMQVGPSNVTAIYEQSILNSLTQSKRLRIYISAPKEDTEFANQISEILLLNDIDSEIVSRNEAAGSGIVSDEALAALRRCQAAIIVVPRDNGSGNLPSNLKLVFNEISAAFVLYQRRVMLLCEESTVLPANLKNLEFCTYDNVTPTWTTCIALLKVIKGFHKQLFSDLRFNGFAPDGEELFCA